MFRSLRILLALSPLIALPSGPARAMTVVERDFADLVERAEQIVVGRVSAIGAGKDPHGGPLTLVTFEDLTVLKGTVGSTLTLELSGGMLDSGRVMSIAEMPEFRVGERAVLFVRGNGTDLCPLVGVWQGRFRVVHDEALGVDVVERSDGARISGLEGRKLRSARRDDPAAMTVEDFQSLIREEMAHPSEVSQ